MEVFSIPSLQAFPGSNAHEEAVKQAHVCMLSSGNAHGFYPQARADCWALYSLHEDRRDTGIQRYG